MVPCCANEKYGITNTPNADLRHRKNYIVISFEFNSSVKVLYSSKKTVNTLKRLENVVYCDEVFMNRAREKPLSEMSRLTSNSFTTLITLAIIIYFLVISYNMELTILVQRLIVYGFDKTVFIFKILIR